MILFTNRLGVAKLNGGWETQSFPKFPRDKFLHLAFVWSLCTSLTVSLRVHTPMPVVTFFFFFSSLGKGWVSMESSVPGPPSGTCAYSVEQYGSH